MDERLPSQSQGAQRPPAVAQPAERFVLIGLVVLFVGLSVVGIDWGLPTSAHDDQLFGAGPAWPGPRIAELADSAAKFDRRRGADVDVDPLAASPAAGAPTPLTATDAAVAAIYQRYRLFTHQPDEMITMMALAQMQPGQLRFDPQLYQYGGLFIYPVGALLKVADLMGLIDARSDVSYYLDHPDAFGRFYLVARVYVVLWGVVGVLVVYALGRRLAGGSAGLVAALLYALLPVVVCMAHEAKPHLPGAVLMLLAVLLAMRCLAKRTGLRDWWLMCAACGASLGMVLSALPIFVLLPVVAVLKAWPTRAQSTDVDDAGARDVGPADWCKTRAGGRLLLGVAVAAGVYLATNPYIVINAVSNRAVLASNFGNSLAMYEVARFNEGLVRVLELTMEGATLPIALVGLGGLAIGLAFRPRAVLPLLAPAVCFFLQFVLIGADKPAEYGRFGVFPDAALAIGTAAALGWLGPRSPGSWRGHWRLGVILLAFVISTLLGSGRYLACFWLDARDEGYRARQSAWIAERPGAAIGVLAEPAPYGCPPIDFAGREVLLFADATQLAAYARTHDIIGVQVLDRYADCAEPGGLARELGDLVREVSPVISSVEAPISWANKPVCVLRAGPPPSPAERP